MDKRNISGEELIPFDDSTIKNNISTEEYHNYSDYDGNEHPLSGILIGIVIGSVLWGAFAVVIYAIWTW